VAFVSLNLKPNKKTLRDFGGISLAMLTLLGLLFFGRDKISTCGLVIFCLVGVLLYTASRISTTLIKPVYLTLIIVIFPIGWVFSHLVMALFYYGIITSYALFFKIRKKDILCRSYDKHAETYWIKYDKKRTTKDYFNQA